LHILQSEFVVRGHGLICRSQHRIGTDQDFGDFGCLCAIEAGIPLFGRMVDRRVIGLFTGCRFTILFSDAGMCRDSAGSVILAEEESYLVNTEHMRKVEIKLQSESADADRA